MPSVNGSNGVGAGADATAQRKGGAQSVVFGAPRVRIYPPCPSSGSEGRFCAFVPEPAPGAQSTADYPQHVPVVYVVRSAGRGEGGSHRLPESGAHIGAQNLGVFSQRVQRVVA